MKRNDIMWICTKDSLPPEGKLVLVYAENSVIDDDPNVCVSVMRLEYGLSIEDRLRMESGELEEDEDNRHNIYSRSDEHGNNLVNYSWIGYGFDEEFGQNVLYWCEIPELPNDVIQDHKEMMEAHKNPTYLTEAGKIYALGIINMFQENGVIDGE
jgi:hypothetical protein